MLTLATERPYHSPQSFPEHAPARTALTYAIA